MLLLSDSIFFIRVLSKGCFSALGGFLFPVNGSVSMLVHLQQTLSYLSELNLKDYNGKRENIQTLINYSGVFSGFLINSFFCHNK